MGRVHGIILLVILILILNFNIILILPFIISFGIFTFNYYSIFRDNTFNNFNLLETYECRFDTFHNKVILYNLQFFNIRVSYIIFDLEISIIFSWLILSFNYFSILIFLIFLGFILVLLKIFVEEILSRSLYF